MFERAERLMANIGKTGWESAANDLLAEFFRGYPLENLRYLLLSDNERAVKAGAWIASELGSRAVPILDDVVRLLTHRLRYVRFFALDTILVCATPARGDAIAAAMSLLRDTDDAVRWKALNFLSRVSSEQLAAGAAYLDEPLSVLSKWLAELESNPERARQLIDRLKDPSGLERMFGVAAAARLRNVEPKALYIAAESTDNDVASFAKEQLSKMSDATS